MTGSFTCPGDRAIVPHTMKQTLAVLTVLFAGTAMVYAQRGLPAPYAGPFAAPVHGYEIVRTYPHDTSALTQGLLYMNGFLYESTGEIECLNRSIGPTPGSSANNVGDADSPYRMRFFCFANAPPENCERTMNGPGSTFSKLTDGVSFHELCNRLGKLMPVDQSSVVVKSRA